MEKTKTTNKLKMSLGAVIIMIFASGYVVNASDNRHICDGFEKKNDTCPNGENFDILKEYDKPDSDWKLDFEVELNYKL